METNVIIIINQKVKTIYPCISNLHKNRILITIDIMNGINL